MGWWLVELEGGEIQQVADDPADWYPDAVRSVALEEPIDLAIYRWDWAAGCAVLRASAEEARDKQWQKAKDYRDLRQQAPLPIAGIVEDRIIIAERDERGQKWIDRFTAIASTALAAGRDFSITFTDFAKQDFTLDAQQILMLSEASVTQQALCHAACRAIAAALEAALAAPGATAESISTIDITAGYPEQPGEEEE